MPVHSWGQTNIVESAQALGVRPPDAALLVFLSSIVTFQCPAFDFGEKLRKRRRAAAPKANANQTPRIHLRIAIRGVLYSQSLASCGMRVLVSAPLADTTVSS